MRPSQEDENGEAEHEEMVNRQSQTEDIAGKLAANLRLRMQRARQQQKQRRKFAHYWLSAEEEAEIVELRFGKDSCAARTVHWIQSHRVQTALLVMLALDVAVVMIEVALTRTLTRTRSLTRTRTPALALALALTRTLTLTLTLTPRCSWTPSFRGVTRSSATRSAARTPPTLPKPQTRTTAN